MLSGLVEVSAIPFWLCDAALSKCFVAVGSIEGVVGSKRQALLPVRGLLVKSRVE